MRVLGATLAKVKVDDFLLDKVTVALDFPSESDRNKALYILFSLADKPLAMPNILDLMLPVCLLIILKCFSQIFITLAMQF